MYLFSILAVLLFLPFATTYGALAGGRPNAVSEGQNAFAGVVNPANAVWIEDRLDLGAFWVHQKLSLNNRDDNPFFFPGKTDFTYRRKHIFTADTAIHKQVKSELGSMFNDYSVSLAYYTTPTLLKLRTKEPIPLIGTTPLVIYDKIEALSLIYSLKLNDCHSIGVSIDYLNFTHLRNGFQHSDHPARSVSPGNVTNRGFDHSHGLGLTIGWRWKITKSLNFGIAWAKKTYCGQFRKYRGFEPHHAENYFPQTLGAGFTYRFTTKLGGRLEVLWSDLGNIPASNNNILPNGKLNLHKRGSDKSPGPGQQDATFINLGIGYAVNSMVSLGASFSHRIKLPKSSIFISHSYTIQTIYDLLSLGANIRYKQHDLFLVFSHGFKNRVKGHMPQEVGGGQFISEKSVDSFSLSWGYLY